MITKAPEIRADFYKVLEGFHPFEQVFAQVTVPPPSASEGNEEMLLKHRAGYHVPKVALLALSYLDNIYGEAATLATIALSLGGHVYKVIKAEEIYGERSDLDEVRTFHKVQAAIAGVVLIIGIIASPILTPVLIGRKIIAEVIELKGAIEERNLYKVAEKVARIGIRTFELVLVFIPEPISKIVLISLQAVEIGYDGYIALTTEKDRKMQATSMLVNLIYIVSLARGCKKTLGEII